MSIKEKLLKIKSLVAPMLEKESYFIVALMVMVSGGAFAAGRMTPAVSSPSDAGVVLRPTMRALPSHASSTLGASVASTSPGAQETPPSKATSLTVENKGMYVGSRKGTKYHLPTCSGAQHISAANKVWFASKDEATSKGYTPASNCKGI